jgi:putative ABC transport system permease protein
LVFASRVKERTHESGILLSLGIGKAKIIGQYLVEVTLVAILAFGLSVFSSGVVAQTIGNKMLDYSISDIALDSAGSGIENRGSGGLTSKSDLLPEFEAKSDLTQINVSVDGMAIILLCVSGFAIIYISVLLAALPMLRLKPRAIFTKMS